jgi:glycerol-3-phosphate acyltransferase PlsX
MKTIAVDGMGGDNAPEAIVKGIEMARDDFPDLQFQLYGDEGQLTKLLKNSERITIVPTTEVVTGEDEPTRAVRRKKDSSLVRAALAAKSGEADAFYSAGNTGAVLTAGVLLVGRIKGIERPGLITVFPTMHEDQQFLMLDVGANAESKPSYLHQFALMGQFYAHDVLGLDHPRVGLLNNGTEADKGDSLHKAVHDLLEKDPDINFVGNVEATNLFNAPADVVVTDGFTGNATLKTMEGTASTLMHLLKANLMDNGLRPKLGALLAKPALKKLATMFDADRAGGAVLIGVNAPVVKSHGNSDENAVYYVQKQLRAMLNHGTVQSVIQYFSTHTEETVAAAKEE